MFPLARFLKSLCFRHTAGLRMRALASLLACLTLVLGLAQPAQAYNYAGNYTFAARWNEWARYKSGSVTIYPEEFGNLWEYDTCPPTEVSAIFPATTVSGNLKQTCDNRWKALIESPYLMGSGAQGVRAKDMSEDWILDFVNPNDSVWNNYFNWYVNNVFINPQVLRIVYPTTLANSGPHAGESVINNPSVLAVGDKLFVMLDADGSLSYYLYGAGGNLWKDSTATTFKNGAWNGKKLTDQLKYMIGYEEYQLYFLEGDSTLHVFDMDLKWVRTDTVALGNELSGYTLGDLVDNLIPGYTYIGWDAGPIVIGVTALRPLDHLQITAAQSTTTTGSPVTLTISACISASGCASTYTRGVSGNVTLSDGSVYAFSIPSGSASTQIAINVASYPAAGYVQVSTSSVSPSALGSPATICQFGGSGAPMNGTCQLGVANPLDHIEINGPASGLSCAASTFTLKACGNASCSTLYTGGVSGNLVVSGSGATVVPASPLAFTIPATQSSVNVALQVTKPPTGNVVGLSVSGLSVATQAALPQYCALGTTAAAAASCSFTVSNSAFRVTVAHHVAEATGVTASIQALKSNADQTACVPAFTGSRAVTLSCSPLDPAASATPLVVGGVALNAASSAAQACDANGQSVTLTFDATGTASPSLSYANVGQMRLKATLFGAATDTNPGMTGQASFIVAPASFTLARTGSGSVRAGDAWGASVSAMTAQNNVATAFGSISTASSHPVVLSWSVTAPTGGTVNAGTLSGTGTSGGAALTAAAFSNGASTVSDLRWNEVGTGRLSATLQRAAGFMDSGLGIQGNLSGVGPFVPAYFEVSAPASCGVFSYSGQPWSNTKVYARNVSGQTTQNFDGSGAMSPSQASSVTLAVDSTSQGMGSLANATVAANRFVRGEGTPASAPSYTFNNKATAPRTVSVQANRSDGVASTSTPLAAMGVRSGRIVASNAFGSERTALDLPVSTQYWSGKYWVVNAEDSCTKVPVSAVALSNFQNQQGQSLSAFVSAPNTLATVSGTAMAAIVQAGNGKITLAAPTAGVTGSVDLAINLGSTSTDQACMGTHPNTLGANLTWLRSPAGGSSACALANDRDPGARATFGIFSPESQRLMHSREIY